MKSSRESFRCWQSRAIIATRDANLKSVSAGIAVDEKAIRNAPENAENGRLNFAGHERFPGFTTVFLEIINTGAANSELFTVAISCCGSGSKALNHAELAPYGKAGMIRLKAERQQRGMMRGAGLVDGV